MLSKTRGRQCTLERGILLFGVNEQNDSRHRVNSAELPDMLTGIKEHFGNGNYRRVWGNKGQLRTRPSNFKMMHVQHPYQS